MLNKTLRNSIIGAGLTLAMLLGHSFITAPVAHADETTTEKAQSSGDKAVKETKKKGRKAKREMRDATGHHSTKEDMKDKTKDVGEDVSHGAKDVENKAD